MYDQVETWGVFTIQPLNEIVCKQLLKPTSTTNHQCHVVPVTNRLWLCYLGIGMLLEYHFPCTSVD